MTFFLIASLFFVHPVPAEMPRAEAYFVRENNTMFLEDKFDCRDLWLSRALLGQWEDDDGRFFRVYRLSEIPPLATDTTTRTRKDYIANVATTDKKNLSVRDNIISQLLPFEMCKKTSRPDQLMKSMKDVDYFHGTNTSSIACAFLPIASENWYYAQWDLIEGDDFREALKCFENEFLRDWENIVTRDLRSEVAPREKPSRLAKKVIPSERELLRADARHSITNYTAWHTTDADEFTILDDLPVANTFIATLTNDLKIMRAKYSSRLKTQIDGSNALCVARIFRDRDEYLDAVGEEMKWTAAYWLPIRRELVAYLPQDGTDELLKTIRHEAFHQYLSYATSMIQTSPWLNEGYAQFFEDENSRDWEIPNLIRDYKKLATLLPELFEMDYNEFYSGDNRERKLKYRLAWSVAVFLEFGAPEVRFQPYKNLKTDYFSALFKTKDFREATKSAFGSSDRRDKFIADWIKFWEEL